MVKKGGEGGRRVKEEEQEEEERESCETEDDCNLTVLTTHLAGYHGLPW